MLLHSCYIYSNKLNTRACLFKARELVFHIWILLSQFFYFVHFGSYLLQWPMIKMLGHYSDGLGEPGDMHKYKTCASYLARSHRTIHVGVSSNVSMRPLLSMLFEPPLVFVAFWPMIKMLGHSTGALNSDARYWDGVSEPRDMHKHRYCASYLAP